MPRRNRPRTPERPAQAEGGARRVPLRSLSELKALRSKTQNPLMRAWEAAQARRQDTPPAPAAEAPPPPSGPSIEERALFRAVMSEVQPLAARHARVDTGITPPPPLPLRRHADESATLHESLHTPLSFEDRLDIGEEAAFLRAGLPRRVLSDLRRGRWVLQGEVDLHGLTRDEARAALGRFLHASLQRGQRCVRVIHGKGLGSPGRVSILKQLSRGWLAQREEILAFCQAGPHAGGSGALLVLLRAPAGARARD